MLLLINSYIAVTSWGGILRTVTSLSRGAWRELTLLETTRSLLGLRWRVILRILCAKLLRLLDVKCCDYRKVDVIEY